jgi:hypothetical protein
MSAARAWRKPIRSTVFAGTLTVRLSDLRGNAARVVNNSLNYNVLQQFDL